MRQFLAILEGPDPREAIPILATEDRELVASVAHALGVRLGEINAAPHSYTIEKLACHNGRCVWFCQACGEPIHRGTGYIEIVNLDPSVGPVGEEPFEPTQDFDSWMKANHPDKDLISAEDLISLGDEWEKQRKVGFKVVHGRCDLTPDSDGYVIEVERISTDRDFIRWLHHLSGKNWMGIDDLREMMELWPIYSERGSAAQRPGAVSDLETAGTQGEGGNENG